MKRREQAMGGRTGDGASSPQEPEGLSLEWLPSTAEDLPPIPPVQGYPCSLTGEAPRFV